MEGTVQQVDSGIAASMECVTVNIIWKILHSRSTVLFQVERIILQLTLCGRYCTAGEQLFCRVKAVYYSELYVEVTGKQVDSVIVA